MNFYDLNGGKCKTPSRDDESCCGKSSEKLRTALDDGFSLILPNGISLKASFDSHAEPYNRFVENRYKTWTTVALASIHFDSFFQ